MESQVAGLSEFGVAVMARVWLDAFVGHDVVPGVAGL